jgi:hypothetical protein
MRIAELLTIESESILGRIEMTYSRINILTFALVSAAAPIVLAQNEPVTTPIANWSYLRHSSTFEEGYLRGTAAVIQSAGQTNYLNSIATINLQEANRRRIENHNLYVRKYFENKEINREYREKYAPVPPTPEQWARITEASLPDRLTAEQFDSATGQLVWPHVLRTEEYKAFRERIDELIANRTPDNSGNGSPSQRELSSLVDAVAMLLKENMDNLTLSQYSAAKWFLMSLDYEAQLPFQANPAANSAVVSSDNANGNGANSDTPKKPQ